MVSPKKKKKITIPFFYEFNTNLLSCSRCLPPIVVNNSHIDIERCLALLLRLTFDQVWFLFDDFYESFQWIPNSSNQFSYDFMCILCTHHVYICVNMCDRPCVCSSFFDHILTEKFRIILIHILQLIGNTSTIRLQYAGNTLEIRGQYACNTRPIRLQYIGNMRAKELDQMM